MFAERCKKAGVFIHRTAENVEGIFLMKLRPDRKSTLGISIKMDDPYGHDVTGMATSTASFGRNRQGFRLRIEAHRPATATATSKPSTPRTASGIAIPAR
jgi:hypothetical protein